MMQTLDEKAEQIDRQIALFEYHFRHVCEEIEDWKSLLRLLLSPNSITRIVPWIVKDLHADITYSRWAPNLFNEDIGKPPPPCLTDCLTTHLV